jgi:hypothetical protein
MSYDLFFNYKFGRIIEESDFRAYFSSRPNYNVNMSSAIYQNEDTGVYFYFNYADDGERNIEDEEEQVSSHLSFNLSYARPHIFGLEAEPEVKAFVEHFDLDIQDPQQEGMGQGPYSSEGFLRGWNFGNQFGHSVLLNKISPGQPAPWALSREKIEKVWFWNMGIRSLYARMATDVYIPRIIYIERNGTLFTAVIWPDGMPAIMPEVDCVLVIRDKLRSTTWFRKSKSLEAFTVDYNLVNKNLEGYSRETINRWRCLTPKSAVLAKSVADWIKNLRKNNDPFKVIAVDSILDAP